MLIELIGKLAGISSFCSNHPEFAALHDSDWFALFCVIDGLELLEFLPFITVTLKLVALTTIVQPCLFSSLINAKTGENYLSGSTADADPRPCLRAGANETRIIATISWQLDFLFFFFFFSLSDVES